MKIKKSFLLTVLLAFAVITNASSCESYQTQKADNGGYVESRVDLNLYEVVIQVENLDSYSEIHGSLGGYGYGGGYGYVSGSVWQDGKGLTRGILLSITSLTSSDIDSEYAILDRRGISQIGEIVIVKTTDRKVTMGIPGDVLTLICTADYEPVCSKTSQNTRVCRDLWEFDYCRLQDITHPNND